MGCAARWSGVEPMPCGNVPPGQPLGPAAARGPERSGRRAARAVTAGRRSCADLRLAGEGARTGAAPTGRRVRAGGTIGGHYRPRSAAQRRQDRRARR